jgi:hypothetical protein
MLGFTDAAYSKAGGMEYTKVIWTKALKEGIIERKEYYIQDKLLALKETAEST